MFRYHLPEPAQGYVVPSGLNTFGSFTQASAHTHQPKGIQFG